MNIRRFLFWLLIIALIWLFRPVAVWGEFQRIWAQRELILRVLVICITLYFAYGIYSLYSQGWFWWLTK
jgi:hypothetical protein